jgi:hypothetical protein
LIWNPELFSLLFRDKIIQSRIMAEGYAHIDTGTPMWLTPSCPITAI